MLSELCREVKNWFEKTKYIGDFEISDGALVLDDVSLQNGQYFRIIGSVFNDGVYKYPTSDLHDEKFEGAIWALAIPKDFLDLAKDIEDWQNEYGGIDSDAMSPFTSESFGGYSYSKSGGGANDGTTNAGTWQGAFSSRLNKWRKI